MPSKVNGNAWDFSPVFDLIHSLSHKDATAGQVNESTKRTARSSGSYNKDNVKEQKEQGLGDFSELWKYLGIDQKAPLPAIPTFEAATAGQATDKDTYASDGALYYPPSSKSVKWRDEESGFDLTDVQGGSPPDTSGLTKTQRKKLNRKARKAAESSAQADEREKKQKQRALNEIRDSEDESENGPLARTSALHRTKPQTGEWTGNVTYKSVPIISKPTTTKDKRNEKRTSDAAGRSPVTLADAKGVPHPQSPGTSCKLLQSPAIVQSLRPASVVPAVAKISTTDKKQRTSPPKSTPHTPMKCPPHPAVIPYQSNSAQPLQSQPTAPIAIPQQTRIGSTLTRKRHEIVPLAPDAVDRNWSLLLKLMNNFPNDRKHLLSPLQLSINRPKPEGIHVFVDASNILIGFNDALKRSRNIPAHHHVPRVDLNFHALALLLERRRPVAKRVLAGSTPNIAAYEQAREVGYETSILDKVLKVRELTERQRRFAVRNLMGGSGYQSGSDSAGKSLRSDHGYAHGMMVPGTSPPALPPQQPKWVEQGVDEILHLKMMESIVDNPIPAANIPTQRGADTLYDAPTMVLATGDAAEAEYSQGFMKMVQRALGFGWNVEVVAWGQSISMAYRNMVKNIELGGKFKIIELDEYAEEMFGEGVS